MGLGDYLHRRIDTWFARLDAEESARAAEAAAAAAAVKAGPGFDDLGTFELRD